MKRQGFKKSKDLYMDLRICLHNLIAKYKQEIDSHEDNKDISPLPAILRYLIIDSLINIYFFLILLRVGTAYYYLISLLCFQVENLNSELPAPVRSDVHLDELSGTVEVVGEDPTVFATSLTDLEALRCLDDDEGGTLFTAVFRVFWVYEFLAEDHE